jgi:hypothetical protein
MEFLARVIILLILLTPAGIVAIAVWSGVIELGPYRQLIQRIHDFFAGRTAGAVFHNAHLANQLPCTNRAEKDGVPVEFPEYVDRTAQQAKNTVRRISLPEEDLPLGEVRASHCGPLIRQQLTHPTRVSYLPTSALADASTQMGNIDRRGSIQGFAACQRGRLQDHVYYTRLIEWIATSRPQNPRTAR